MKKIPLTRGKYGHLGLVALIDDEDFERVQANGPWIATKVKTLKNGQECFYAISHRVGYMHRFLMNAKTGEQVDHRNHKTLDNQARENLRKATHSQNNFNQRKLVEKTSQYMGVCLYEGVWLAQIQLGGGTRATRKCKVIGRFPDEMSAAFARDQFVRNHPEVREFATLNFPQNFDYSGIKRFQKRSSSEGLYGVSIKAGKWRVRLTDPKTHQTVNGGVYEDRLEAGRASDALMKKLGIVGHLNFPEGGSK